MTTPRYEFYETDEKLTLSIFDRGADPANVHVEFGPRKVIYEHGQISLTLQPLKGEINPIVSDYSVGKVKIEIRLVKIAQFRWGALIGDSPDVLENKVAPTTPSSFNTSSTSTTTSSKPRKNWDNITTTILSKETEKSLGDDPNAGGDHAVNGFFQKLYEGADDNTKRAMMKSYVESAGTTLSTNWGEIGGDKVEVKPPQGSEYKRWG